MATVLVVDDEPLQRGIIKTILIEENFEVLEAGSVNEALKIYTEYQPDIVLTDLKMPEKSGIDLLDEIKAVSERPPTIIIMTAFGTISSAVEAIKKGAFDYLTKPLEKEPLLIKLRQAMERVSLLDENLSLKKEIYRQFNIEGIIGESPAMKQVLETVKKVAPTNATVLILGESGTGKELIARAIHYSSLRKKASFTALNCASIPENLLESELFGYEPGAFTGATSRKKGLIESTNGGTLFLDEIGDMPVALQAKLLRVLQDGEIRRLGGKDSFRVDIRIIAATNRNLEEMIKEGTFREDLYYRLRVVTIKIPPLRERRQDIPLLCEYFIKRYNQEFGKRIKGISEEAMNALMNYSWPGNIRQLQAVIERAVILTDRERIEYDDIREDISEGGSTNIMEFDIPDEGIVFEELEKALLKRAMEKSGFVAKRAAELLGMSYKTFWYRWEKFGLGKGSEKKN